MTHTFLHEDVLSVMKSFRYNSHVNIVIII